MLPVIALVGRPNVGKSTLFNCLTQTRSALVADFPGLTRDRQYGLGKIGPLPYLVVDTGGLSGETDAIDALVARQAHKAIEEADAVLLLVDARAGLAAADEEIATRLRRSGKALFLVANKTEHLDPAQATADFHALGIGAPWAISATHRRGVDALMEAVLAAAAAQRPADTLPALERTTIAADDGSIRLAIVGRPNVGKSTLVNRLLGEERVLAFDQPGTTRDAVAIPFEKDGTRYTLIDTAGVRRRSRVDDAIEKFSVIKTLQAIEEAHVVVMVLDARQGIADQDATLLGYVLDSGRALVLAVNKWDKLEPEVRDEVRGELARKLAFIDFANTHYISALHGSGVMDLFRSVRQAYAAATRKLSTPELTRILEDAVATHQPPLVHGRSIKLRYAHPGGQNPPVIVIHGSRVEHIPDAYRRYLINTFRRVLRLHGTPIRVDFKAGDNPYKPEGLQRKQTHRPLAEERAQRIARRRAATAGTGGPRKPSPGPKKR
ncbi:GTP-binding protein [Plasticicumulans lactativorans]|uniref:GTPase Der n=1 Tax=Plasticicumulans lactativorans TaxID=1133106 RepID=A0A4R2L527_9GAMM|nr:ribosome biogenesis GTPase Der [Plasticicumulans lactativorans]TCO82411.1 GTP-binding protein [Plasticicumulans lactativorans]